MNSCPMELLNLNQLLNTATIKIKAAANLNNQNISSSDFIPIAETLEAIYIGITSEKPYSAKLEAVKLARYLKESKYQFLKGTGSRLLAEALVLVLDSLVMVLKELATRKEAYSQGD